MRLASFLIVFLGFVIGLVGVAYFHFSFWFVAPAGVLLLIGLSLMEGSDEAVSAKLEFENSKSKTPEQYSGKSTSPSSKGNNGRVP